MDKQVDRRRFIEVNGLGITLIHPFTVFIPFSYLRFIPFFFNFWLFISGFHFWFLFLFFALASCLFCLSVGA